MNKAMVYATVLEGTIPSEKDFAKMEDFFGITPDGLDGDIHKMVADKALVDLLRVLYHNTIKMCIAADLWEASQGDFPVERLQCRLIN